MCSLIFNLVYFVFPGFAFRPLKLHNIYVSPTIGNRKKDQLEKWTKNKGGMEIDGETLTGYLKSSIT